ncbi:MAG TPA: hypothetical protein VFL80_07080 [Thermoanaerobaculia bacterium]|nr:hypothetical protein [Thermoanaerobaculia bacterium]
MPSERSRRPLVLLAAACVLFGFFAGWFVKTMSERRAVSEQRLANELDAAAQAALALGALDRNDAPAAAAVLEARLSSAVDRAFELARGRERLDDFPAPNLSAAMMRAAQHAERTGRVATAARARALSVKLAPR